MLERRRRRVHPYQARGLRAARGGFELGVLEVSLYALGVAVGAPVFTALAGRIPRKQLPIGLMMLFTVGNLVAWMAPGAAY